MLFFEDGRAEDGAGEPAPSSHAALIVSVLGTALLIAVIQAGSLVLRFLE